MKVFVCILLSALFLRNANITENAFNPKLSKNDSIKTNVKDILFDNHVFLDNTLLYKGSDNKEYIYKFFFEKNVLFGFQESTLKNESKESLNKLIDILIENPTVKIKIIGHTDIIGSLEFNQYLSTERARAVADYLMMNGVPAEQISEIVGKNFSDPLADNMSKSGRAANRCVEIFVILPKLLLENVEPKRNSIKNDTVPQGLKKILNQVIYDTKQLTETDIEIDGLIVDDTKTKNAKEFYDIFYSLWNPPANAKNYTITISEKPYRLNYTLVVIAINESTVYQTVLQPRQDMIENQSHEAISVTQDYLENYEEIMNMINGDDLTGSGIY